MDQHLKCVLSKMLYLWQLGLDVPKNPHESNFYKICKYRFWVIENFQCFWRYCMFHVFFRWFTVDNMIISIWEIFFPMIYIPSLKLTVRPWKWMVGRWNFISFPFGARPIFRGELLVSGRVYTLPMISSRVVKATMWRPRNHLWMGRIEVGDIICDTYPPPNH